MEPRITVQNRTFIKKNEINSRFLNLMIIAYLEHTSIKFHKDGFFKHCVLIVFL